MADVRKKPPTSPGTPGTIPLPPGQGIYSGGEYKPKAPNIPLPTGQVPDFVDPTGWLVIPPEKPVTWSPGGKGKGNAATQKQVGGNGTMIPIRYGLQRVGARIGALTVQNGALYMLCVWGEGEIDAVEQVYINDEAAPSGTVVASYTGTAGQGVDPTLAAAFAAAGQVYTDTLPNIAYSVLKVMPKKNAGFPEVTAQIRGNKVALTDGGTPTYSTCPAFIIADFITNTRYGMRSKVNWTDVAALAARNNGTVGGETRHVLSISIDSLTSAEQWLLQLCDYASAIPVKVGDTYRLFVDAPGSSVATIGKGDIVENTLAWDTRAPQDAPTVIEVVYTDTSTTPWKDASCFVYAPGADTGATDRRVSRVSKPGIQRYSEAYRYGVQMLNGFLTSDLKVRWQAFDDALVYLPGDVVTLNCTPFSSKLVRILSIAPSTSQLWAVTAAEYDPAKWSDAVVAGPTTLDTSLPSPLTVPLLTGLTASEEIYQVQTGLYASRIRASWSSPESNFIYLGGYEVKVLQAGVVVEGPVAVPAGVTSYATGPLEENLTYVFSVAAVSSSGPVGPATTASITTNGKTARPSDVPYFYISEAAGEVRFNWSPASDADLTAHEIRFGPRATATWATATLLDRIPHPAQNYATRTIPPGDLRFFIKGLDSVRTDVFPFGQESLNARTFDLVVGGDPDLFLAADYAFTTPSLTNMVEERLLDTIRWVTDYGGVWNTIFSSNLDTYTDPLNTYSGSGTSSLLTEALDLGQSYAGQFLASPIYTDETGTAQVYIEVSPDGVAWTQYAGLSAQASGRYVRVRIETTGAMIVTSLGDILVSVATLSETGEVTTSAGGPVTVSLERKYTRVKTIQLTADVTAGQANPGYQNVVLSNDPRYWQSGYSPEDYVDQAYNPTNTFDVRCWDASNVLIARAVKYVFEGI